MPISAEERAAAKKAYSEMSSCNVGRTMVIAMAILCGFIILFFGIAIASGMHVEDHGRDLRGWEAYWSMLACLLNNFGFFVACLALNLITYLRFRPRYAENLKLVTELERKYGGEFPYGLQPEIENGGRAEKRALLWRLDAFLSRKVVKK